MKPAVVLLPLVPDTAITPSRHWAESLRKTSGDTFLASRPGRFDPSPAPRARMALADSLPATMASLSESPSGGQPSAEDVIYVGAHVGAQILLARPNHELVTQGKGVVYVLTIYVQRAGAHLRDDGDGGCLRQKPPGELPALVGARARLPHEILKPPVRYRQTGAAARADRARRSRGRADPDAAGPLLLRLAANLDEVAACAGRIAVADEDLVEHRLGQE